MSTHCGIAVKTEKGYETIYCHWNGYPEYMLPMLNNNYKSEELAKKLEGVSLTISTKVSATGVIYGSVGAIQIAEELAKLGFEIDRKIIVAEAAKEVGSYSATIKLHKEVSVKVPFEVVAEAAAE